MKYRLIRSRRKSVALEVRPDATLVVRAPRFFPELLIRRLLQKKREWILQKQKVMQARREAQSLPAASGELARRVAEERVSYWVEQMNLKFTKVRINNARKQWGSCSAQNKLSFARRLFAAPLEIIDYVVVHELAHIKYKNHSRQFWQAVSEVLPDYKKRQKWLKEHGHLLV